METESPDFVCKSASKKTTGVYKPMTPVEVPELAQNYIWPATCKFATLRGTSIKALIKEEFLAATFGIFYVVGDK